MAAVQALLATLNELAQGGSLAGSWLRRGGDSFSAAHTELYEPWDEGEYAQAGVEPLLEEMLYDPLVQLLMRADRIEPAEVRRVLDFKRRELSA